MFQRIDHQEAKDGHKRELTRGEPRTHISKVVGIIGLGRIGFNDQVLIAPEQPWNGLTEIALGFSLALILGFHIPHGYRGIFRFRLKNPGSPDPPPFNSIRSNS